jgi:hypothetical protein
MLGMTMQVLIAVFFAVLVCAVIEFIVPKQIAIFYSMLGGPTSRESGSAINTPKRRKVRLTRFLVLLPFAIAMTYFTILRKTPMVICMMIFTLLYSSYVSFVEIRRVRKHHLALLRQEKGAR